MGKHRLFLVLALALSALCFVFWSCGKEEEEKPGSIFGVVTDFSTGEPVNSANVQLRPGGETTLTGADGMYEFTDVVPGSYSIKVSKAEYTDLVDDYVIEVLDGKRVRRDVQIQKRPVAIHLYDNDSQEISELDFGSDEGVTKKTFNIFNGGTHNIDYEIEKSVDWITNISQPNGTINVGATKPIVVTINRRLLAIGDNTTILLVTSNEGGGRELTVKARNTGALPAVSISEVIDIDSVTYRIKCEVLEDGGMEVTERGICWNTFGDPTMDDETIPYSNGGLGQYAIRLEHLTMSTHYYVRAYAKNELGVGLSDMVDFVTGAVITAPKVTSVEVCEITPSSAVCKGEVTDDGGAPLIERGVCWGTSANPGITGQHQAASSAAIGAFSISLTGLEANTTYHARAYAKNNRGTSYGRDMVFTTTEGLPTVVTSSVTNITANGAKCGGTVTDQGASPVTERGICWNTSHNPIVSDNHASSGTGTGSFTVSMTNLTPNVTYYVRAYAKNQQGTAYGSEVSFKALEGLPVVTTGSITGITTTSARGSGNVSDQGGSPVTDRGLCWSTQFNPTVSGSHASSGSGVGSFSVDITGLTPGTKYYVRAFAVNSQGTTYGEQKEFTTVVVVPTVTTLTPTNITQSTAIGKGEVTNDGGATVTECGVCWSTSHNPTISSSHASGVLESGTITVDLTGLTANTTYYVKAYAKNSAGIGYGNEVSFITTPLPVYNISATADPHEGGTIIGAGSYQQGQSCTIKATPASGYSFLNWTEGGSQVSTDLNYTFTVEGNRTFVAHFQIQSFTISISSNPSDAGMISGGGSFNYGETCTVTATPNTGYTFLRWTENGAQVSTNPNYTFTVNSSRTLVAQFQAMSYNISTSANPPEGGGASGGGTCQYGQQCTVHATANSGYHFVDWTENGVSVSSSANYTFTVTSNRTLVANFAPETFYVTVSSYPANGGVVTGGGSYSFGQSCTVTATPSSGYLFIDWTENGSVVSSEASYTFTVSANCNLEAHFAVIPTGAVEGLFAINVSQQKVFFSQGNLQYIGVNGTWKFADNQWDIIGLMQGSNGQDVTRDLFGWGTSGYNHGAVCYQPWSTSLTNSDYNAYGNSIYNLYDQTGKADWGYNAIVNGGNSQNSGWRTLTIYEWNYVFNSRTTASGIRYARAIVCGMNGILLLPDSWNSSYYDLQNPNTIECDYSSNVIDYSAWMTYFASHGCVFLPCASYREGTSYCYYNGFEPGYYWSSTSGLDDYAYFVRFTSNDIITSGWRIYRHLGLAVRLVRNAE